MNTKKNELKKNTKSFDQKKNALNFFYFSFNLAAFSIEYRWEIDFWLQCKIFMVNGIFMINWLFDFYVGVLYVM